VLCPVDFSDSSHQAVLLAGDLVRRGRAVVTLMHVNEVSLVWAGEPPDFALAGDVERRATARLDEWASELRGATDLAVFTQTRNGRAGAETLAVLDEIESIDLVVMGTQGRTGIKRALLGSVAEKVVRHARCPVLVTRTRGD
jgi:nucleotide-binding universal stress UspA family protein